MVLGNTQELDEKIDTTVMSVGKYDAAAALKLVIGVSSLPTHIQSTLTSGSGLLS